MYRRGAGDTRRAAGAVGHRVCSQAKAASALDHPNICNIHEINDTPDGQLYLVMAHYDGETLKDRIARGPLKLNDAIDIATQVGEGLAEAHGAGIVHRDIKPANLLVTKTGVVKILDFGLAKLAGSEGVTQTGTTVGTVAYMSPEQARGKKVDHRTDIWSLGVVLYEMLAGTRPFQGENLLSLADAIRNSEPEPVSRGSSSLNPTLSRAMNKDVGQRYQTVTELLNDLRSGSTAVPVMTTAEPDLSVHRRPPLHQHERRSRTGVLLRWPCRGVDRRSRPARDPPGSGAHIGISVQGAVAGRVGDR